MSCFIGNTGWLWSKCRGIRAHLEFIWCTRSSFVFLWGPQGLSRLVTVFLETLWSSIKEVKVLFMFGVENGIPLDAMQGNRASSHGDGEVSWFFWSCSQNLGYILKLRWGWPFKTRVGSAMSRLLSSCDGHIGILLEACCLLR